MANKLSAKDDIIGIAVCSNTYDWTEINFHRNIIVIIVSNIIIASMLTCIIAVFSIMCGCLFYTEPINILITITSAVCIETFIDTLKFIRGDY
ncbi:MAG: hypothetical protein WC346_09730 [Methanogenium sp.]|jgi:hypothetical protein